MGLPTERLGRFLVEDEHAAAGVRGRAGGDETGQPGPDDDDVGVLRRHAAVSHSVSGQAEELLEGEVGVRAELR